MTTWIEWTDDSGVQIRARRQGSSPVETETFSPDGWQPFDRTDEYSASFAHLQLYARLIKLQAALDAVEPCPNCGSRKE